MSDGTLTAEGRRVRDLVEEQTAAAMRPLLDATGPGLPELTRQLDEWSALLVAGGGAPRDVDERVSG